MYEDEYEFDEVVRVFTPLDLHALYEATIEEFGNILAEELKKVQGHSKLPKYIAREIKSELIRLIKEDDASVDEFQENLSRLLYEADVPRADEVAESVVAKLLRRVKKLLKKAEKKRR